jgi:hypothetical protein
MPFTPHLADSVDAIAFPVFKRAARAKFGPMAVFAFLRLIYLLWELYKLAKAAHLFGTRVVATGQMTPLLHELDDYPPEVRAAIAERADALAKGLPFE